MSAVESLVTDTRQMRLRICEQHNAPLLLLQSPEATSTHDALHVDNEYSAHLLDQVNPSLATLPKTLRLLSMTGVSSGYPRLELGAVAAAEPAVAVDNLRELSPVVGCRSRLLPVRTRVRFLPVSKPGQVAQGAACLALSGPPLPGWGAP